MKKILFLLLFTLSSNLIFSQGFNQFERDTGLEHTSMKGAKAGGDHLFTYNYHSLFTSGNNGDSWKEILDVGSSYVKGVAVEDTMVYILIQHGSPADSFQIYYSSINNISWSSNSCVGTSCIGTNCSGCGISQFLVHNGYLFVGNIHGDIFKSSDIGLNWFDSSNVLEAPPWTCGNNGSSVIKLLSVGNVLYVGTSCFGVLSSTNNGQSWFQLNNGIPMITPTRVYDLAKSPSKFFAKTNKGFFQSTNNGQDWVEDPLSLSGQHHVDVQNNFVLISDPVHDFVYSQNNGTSWDYLNNEFMSYVNTETIISDNTGFYLFPKYSSKGGVSKLNTEDSSFSYKSYGLTKNYARHMFHKDSTYFLSTLSGGLYYSDDASTNWEIMENQLLGKVVNSSTEFDTTFIVATDDGIFHSYDTGLNWDTANVDLDNIEINSVIVYDSTLFAGTDDGVFLRHVNNSVWASSNSGLTDSTINSMYLYSNMLYACTDLGVYFLDTLSNSWTNYDSQLSSFKIYSIAIKGDTVVAGSDHFIFQSVDNGITWDAHSIAPGEKVKSILFVDADIYAGCSDGVYRYTNNQPSWNLMFSVINVEELHIANSYLFASTTEGLFKFIIPSSGTAGIIESDFDLTAEIYPNPTSGSLNIKSASIEIDEIIILDVTGKIVKSMAFEKTIDVSNLSRGVFFIKLIAGDRTITKKFIKQ